MNDDPEWMKDPRTGERSAEAQAMIDYGRAMYGKPLGTPYPPPATERARARWHAPRARQLPPAGKGLSGRWDDFRDWLRRLFS